jgi:hypothetical protein
VNFKINSDKTAAVSMEAYFMPITAKTPRNVNCFVLTIHGVARTGNIKAGEEKQYLGWFPCPKNPGDLKERHEYLGETR